MCLEEPLVETMKVESPGVGVRVGMGIGGERQGREGKLIFLRAAPGSCCRRETISSCINCSGQERRKASQTKNIILTRFG